MKISVEDVLIKTASIEVKVLTLTRKQVTMGVFRQLDMRNCINMWDLELYGKIWGRVNYHHKCEDEYKDEYIHMHLVWQDGEHIYHDIMYRYINKQFSSKLLNVSADDDKKVWEEFYDTLKEQTDHLFIAV